MISITGETVSQTITGKTIVGTVYTSKCLVIEVSSVWTHLKAPIQVEKETRRTTNTGGSIDTFSTASSTRWAFHVPVLIKAKTRNASLSFFIHFAIHRLFAGNTSAIKIAVEAVVGAFVAGSLSAYANNKNGTWLADTLTGTSDT